VKEILIDYHEFKIFMKKLRKIFFTGLRILSEQNTKKLS